ncbi:MAG: hypothetical protein WD673_06465 [Alphaproteobacteria bacterium]
MSALRRIGIVTPLLAVGTLALAGAIGHGLVMRANTAVPTEAQIAASAVPELGPIEPFALPELAALAAIVERPLFSETRRAPEPLPPPPPEPEPVVEAAPAVPPPPRVELGQFKLVGIIDDGGRRYGLLRPLDGEELVRAEVGAVLGDWRVEAVSLDSVVLSQGGVRDTIMLRDNKAAPQPTGRAKLLKAALGAQRGQGDGLDASDVFTRSLRSSSGNGAQATGDGSGGNGKKKRKQTAQANGQGSGQGDGQGDGQGAAGFQTGGEDLGGVLYVPQQ